MTHGGENAISFTAQDIFFDRTVKTKDDALVLMAGSLQSAGIAKADYLTGMREREAQISTYLGNGIAIPHGTPEHRDAVMKTGVKIMACPQGIDWGEGQTARLVIAIAARGNEHLNVLRNLTHTLSQDGVQQALEHAAQVSDILSILQGNGMTAQHTMSAGLCDAEATFTVTNVHGLHARPSAVLVKEIKQWKSSVTVENLDTHSAVVDARNLMKVVSLGARQQHRLHFSARGEDARDVINAINAAFNNEFGEASVANTISPALIKN